MYLGALYLVPGILPVTINFLDSPFCHYFPYSFEPSSLSSSDIIFFLINLWNEASPIDMLEANP